VKMGLLSWVATKGFDFCIQQLQVNCAPRAFSIEFKMLCRLDLLMLCFLSSVALPCEAKFKVGSAYKVSGA
jgi:hypothetical protein